jgi:O-antigen ligase
MSRAWAIAIPVVSGSKATAGLIAAATITGAAVVGVGAASAPFLTMGAVLGLLLAVFALTRPIALVGLMLVIGAADLSYLTGGFKGMFAHLGGLDMNGIRLIAMTAALSLVVVADRGVGQQVFRPTTIFYVALLVYGAITLTFSPAPLGGLRMLLKLAYPLLVFLVIVGIAPSRERLDRLMDAVLIGAVVLCVVVNPIYVLYGNFERVIGGWVRLQGLGIHQNPFSFYLTILILIGVVRFSTRRQLRYLLLSAVSGAWMVLTVTRIAFLAVLVALLMIGIASAVIARQTRVLAAAVVVGAVLAVVFAPPVLERTFGFVPSAGELITLVRHPQKLYVGMNMEGRQVIWAIAYQAFQTSPLTGLGFGASPFILTLHFPWWSNVPLHNEYLRLLTDAGLTGFALFACAMIAWGVAAVRAASIPDRTVREYALPAIGSVAAFAVIALTDNPFDYYGPFTQYVGYLCGGAVAAVACHRRVAAEATAARPEPLQHERSVAQWRDRRLTDR